jgi:hypothetical protein
MTACVTPLCLHLALSCFASISPLYLTWYHVFNCSHRWSTVPTSFCPASCVDPVRRPLSPLQQDKYEVLSNQFASAGIKGLSDIISPAHQRKPSQDGLSRCVWTMPLHGMRVNVENGLLFVGAGGGGSGRDYCFAAWHTVGVAWVGSWAGTVQGWLETPGSVSTSQALCTSHWPL